MTRIAVIIPFRDRGIDLRRGANLEVVQAWWYAHGFDARIISDGLKGDAQFNRHRAYNRAVADQPNADVLIFTEADMLIHMDQIREACVLAAREPGLVVPFTQYRYLSDKTTATVRDMVNDGTPREVAEWWSLPADDPQSLFHLEPESTMDNGRSIGAVNVMSRETIEATGGFTELTRGNWYDDRIIEEGFAFLTGHKTRYVEGPAVHLYHLPGHAGEHLTDADRRATQRNKDILVQMRTDVLMRRRDNVRRLMEYREGKR